jgi:hypothetical protein
MSEKKNLDPEKVLKRADEIIDRASKKYVVEYYYYTKSTVADKTESYLLKLGKFLTKEHALTDYKNKYEEAIIRKAPGKFTEYMFVGVFTEDEHRLRG